MLFGVCLSVVFLLFAVQLFFAILLLYTGTDVSFVTRINSIAYQ